MVVFSVPPSVTVILRQVRLGDEENIVVLPGNTPVVDSSDPLVGLFQGWESAEVEVTVPCCGHLLVGVARRSPNGRVPAPVVAPFQIRERDLGWL